MAQAVQTVTDPAQISKHPPRRGNHGGAVSLFLRHHGPRMLVVFAEIKKDQCWLITGFWEASDEGFVVASSRPPIVEIDTGATAVYVRFGSGKVSRTSPFGEADSLVTIDYDRQSRIVGIELIGAKEFGINYLLGDFPLQIDAAVLNRARYVAANSASQAQ
jgi:uncharacterized protein YuzE